VSGPVRSCSGWQARSTKGKKCRNRSRFAERSAQTESRSENSRRADLSTSCARVRAGAIFAWDDCGAVWDDLRLCALCGDHGTVALPESVVSTKDNELAR
jgi:hypothetical protein